MFLDNNTISSSTAASFTNQQRICEEHRNVTKGTSPLLTAAHFSFSETPLKQSKLNKHESQHLAPSKCRSWQSPSLFYPIVSPAARQGRPLSETYRSRAVKNKWHLLILQLHGQSSPFCLSCDTVGHILFRGGTGFLHNSKHSKTKHVSMTSI